jgi:hypothetical protein
LHPRAQAAGGAHLVVAEREQVEQPRRLEDVGGQVAAVVIKKRRALEFVARVHDERVPAGGAQRSGARAERAPDERRAAILRSMQQCRRDADELTGG